MTTSGFRFSLPGSFVVVAALLLGIASLFGATVQTISVPSAAMKKDVPATVILPDACMKEEKRLPVLYLLHGYGGDYQSWPKIARLDELAEQYGVIVVCPDGGIGSWYLGSRVAL
jgi:poly(3-hydroxybutyrate) depolymerase